MTGCPLRNFEECPQHNKKGGCEFWLSYSTDNKNTNAKIEGCANVLTPLLLIESINNTALVANELNKVGAEFSKARIEAIKEQMANRQQFLSLAQGERVLINPDYSKNWRLKNECNK